MSRPTYHILTEQNVRISTRSKRLRDELLMLPGAMETTGPGSGNWGNPNAWHKSGKTAPKDPQTGRFTNKETSKA